jgi:glucose 1-dehydrogenase
MSFPDLQGRVAIITGAGSGIGRAIALEYGSCGIKVVVNYHSDADEADAVVKEIETNGGAAIKVQADVSREQDVMNLFEKTVAEFSRLDILVNNAGIERNNNLIDMTVEQWQQVIDTNLTGYFLCSRQAARVFLSMKKNASAEERAIGNMIFICSVHDQIPWAGHANYTASKGGVMMLMRTIAQELAPQKIRVNSISPGAIRTSINKKAWSTPEAMKKLDELIPYQRIGEPEDIARAAAWLASEYSDYVTGETIYVDGGMMLYPSFIHGG